MEEEREGERPDRFYVEDSTENSNGGYQYELVGRGSVETRRAEPERESEKISAKIQ